MWLAVLPSLINVTASCTCPFSKPLYFVSMADCSGDIVPVRLCGAVHYCERYLSVVEASDFSLAGALPES